MKCSNCGFVFGDNVKFCPECGTAVPVAEEVAEAPVEEKVEAVTEPVVEEKEEVVEKKVEFTPSPVSETETFNTTYTNTYSEPAEPVSKGLAIGSLVCGIISVIMCCCCAWLGVVLGIVGVVLGCLQQKDEFGKKPTMAIVGIILSSVSIATSLLSIIITFTPAYKNMLNDLKSSMY